ncbi:hypothetical protein [Aestuariirhabdus sp. LZHN29]|uniref:hypothetical protein n=1 Tax=Aestuariirhabdus sp. LZHN29 TaxID=3417462 RepID=UPI003CEAFDA0
MRAAIILLLLLCAWPLQADSQTVQWARTGYPPFFILSGHEAGQGSVDRLVEHYMQRLPQYSHLLLEASLQRAFREMQRGLPVCHASLVVSEERKQFMDFSEANQVQFANGLVILGSRRSLFEPFMDDEGYLDFSSLVTQSTTSIQRVEGRSYSPEIDLALKSHSAVPFQVEKGVNRNAVSMLRLLSGFVDGWLARPEEALYQARLMGRGDEIAFIPIRQAREFSLARVGCAKGEWNKEFFQQLNAVIRDSRGEPAQIRAYQRWLPQSLWKKHADLTRQQFTP